jgi:hypothetical protein
MTQITLLPWKFATHCGLPFDTGHPTRAGLEASSNLQQPRLFVGTVP